MGDSFRKDEFSSSSTFQMKMTNFIYFIFFLICLSTLVKPFLLKNYSIWNIT